jgi:photosystem II stability/assembly factor-like uncharacterized protein
MYPVRLRDKRLAISGGLISSPRLTIAALLLTFFAVPSVLRAGVNVWTGNGPENQEFQLIAVAPTQPRTIFATFDRFARTSALIRSTDGGISWSRSDAGLSGNALSMAVSPLSPETLFVGMFQGLFTSTDAGDTWALRAGSPTVSVRGFGLGEDPVAIFYLAAVGAPKSTDGGGTWSNTGLGFVLGIAVDPTTSATVYAATPGDNHYTKMYRSTDGGANWDPADHGAWSLSYGDRVRVAVDRDDSKIVFIADGGLRRSTDSGATSDWVFFDCGARSILPTPGAVFAGSRGVCRSTDSGATWARLAGTSGFLINDLAGDPADVTRWYAASTAGILHATSEGFERLLPSVGASMEGWSIAGGGLSSETAYLATHGGVFKTTDDGETWTQKQGVLGYKPFETVIVLPGSPETVIAGGYYGSPYRSTDGGETWEIPTLYDNATAFAADPSQPDTVYAASLYNAIWKSTDRGSSWTELPPALPAPYFINYETLAVHPSGRVYAADDYELYSTSDDGVSWGIQLLPKAQNGGCCYGWSYTAYLALDPNNVSTVYIGTDNGLFKTTDSGEHWIDITHGLPKPYIDAILVDRDRPSVITVGSDGGVYRSVNGGATWIGMNAGFTGSPIVQSLARSPLDPNKFFSGTLGVGGGHAFRLVLPQGDVNGDTKVDVLDVFELINALFAGGTAPIGPADANGDGKVDVADVFYLINYLFASGPPPIALS